MKYFKVKAAVSTVAVFLGTVVLRHKCCKHQLCAILQMLMMLAAVQVFIRMQQGNGNFDRSIDADTQNHDLRKARPLFLHV